MNEVLHIVKAFNSNSSIKVSKLDLKDAKEVKLFKGVKDGI
jgi:hypothetical protein